MTERDSQIENLHSTLFNEVFVPAFVKLAADKGINISTEAELEQALRLATLCESYMSKQSAATDNSGILKQAADALEGHLYGVADQNKAQAEQFVKAAAQNPAVKQAFAKVASLA